jgi:GMP synthase-like glutamine amidotransferase
MLLIVQNESDVPLGAYANYLQTEGIPFTICSPGSGEVLPSPASLSAVIVLGGSMGVHDTGRHPFLVKLKEFIRTVVAQQIPLLGICLGGQLLAETLGGEVTSGSPCGEKGTLPVFLTKAGTESPLFTGIEPEFFSFQWHNDSFAIPEQAIHLAFSPACPGQAFQIGASAFGIQFHPEVNRDIIADWCSWSKETAQQSGAFLARFDQHAPRYNEASRRLLFNFLRIAKLV